MEAYPRAPFPVVDANGHCVLCQQPLHSSAVERQVERLRAIAALDAAKKRIVSLAACFADVLAEDRNVPFVFDDPMSSLDQEYEASVADRLVELAASQQVIVFTHRLSFMMALSQSASSKAVETQVSSLERTRWGAGVPGGSPLQAQRPDRALNQLVGERLPAIRKAEAARNLDDVRSRTAELCRDLRITLENIVEKVLLADVVKRFRRDINTRGKQRPVEGATQQSVPHPEVEQAGEAADIPD